MPSLQQFAAGSPSASKRLPSSNNAQLMDSAGVGTTIDPLRCAQGTRGVQGTREDVLVTLYELIATVIAAIGLVGGAIGFFRSGAADRKSTKAAADAAIALSRSASANEEAAAALKRANELVESQLPKRRIHFSASWVSGDTYAITCDDLPADSVLIERADRVHPLEDVPRSLAPGDSVRFMVSPMTFGSASAPRLRIGFTDPATGDSQVVEWDLNL